MSSSEEEQASATLKNAVLLNMSSSEEDNDEKEKKVTSGKRKSECLMCKKLVCDLPRHMRHIHKWSEEKAKKVKQLFQNRKAYQWKSTHPGPPKAKDYHKHRRCPVKGCYSVVKRLPNHLRSVHHIQDAEKLADLLSQAKEFITVGEKLENAASMRRCEVKKFYRANDTLVDYVGPTQMAYVAPSKSNYQVIRVHPRAEDEDVAAAVTRIDPVPKVITSKVVEEFQNFLTSADGGRLNTSKTAPQYAQMMKVVLKVVGGLEGDISKVLSRTAVRDTFLSQHCTELCYAPRTIQKYLTALDHFYTFLLDQEVNVIGYAPEDIRKMKTRCQNWSASYNAECRAWEKRRCEEEQDLIITPEQIAIYERSEVVAEAKQLFDIFKTSDRPVTRSEFCTMRDYLFIELEIQNSHRSGVYANMTLEEFEHPGTEGGLVRIKVKEHKTAVAFGSAKVYMADTIYEYLDTFVNRVRSQIPSIDDEPHVFISFQGVPLASGAVSRQLNCIWQRSGVYAGTDPPKRNITTTVFRKSVSTAVLEKKPEAAKDVAQLLAHSQKTQSRYYDARRMDLSSARGAKEVRELLRGAGASPRKEWSVEEVAELRLVFGEVLANGNISIDHVREKRPELTVICDVSDTQIRDKLRSLHRYRQNCRKSLQLQSSSSISAKEVSSTGINPTTNQVVDLNDDHVEANPEQIAEQKPMFVSDGCIDVVTHSNTESDMADVLAESGVLSLGSEPGAVSLESEPGAVSLESESGTVSLDHKSGAVNPPAEYGVITSRTDTDIDDGDDYDRDPDFHAVVVKKQKVFTALELAVIARCCSHLITGARIGNESVKNALEGDNKGHNLLKKFSIDTLKNRVKYERKMRIAKGSFKK